MIQPGTGLGVKTVPLYHHHPLVLALVRTYYRDNAWCPRDLPVQQVTNSLSYPTMSSPRRNTRHFNSPPGIGNPPPPGFQTVLNSLLAQRDAALGVSVPSQPIARWSSSSQPEILWELLAERRRAGIPPTLSQEQNAALEAAIAHIPPTTVNDTIVSMEEAVLASQGGHSPALTVVSDTFWEAIQLALPASGIHADITTTPPFTEARHPSQSMGSSPMDISSDLPSPGRLAAPAPSPLQLGDDPNAPIILSSDTDTQVPSGVSNTRGQHVGNEAASPLPAEHEASSPLPASSMSGERPSDHFPSASVSFGDDAAHAVTNLQGPPSERTQTEKIWDLKSLARQYARDRGSCDDVHISYLEDLEDRDSDNLRLAQMLAM
jgi:hypothetical protein